MNIKYSSLIIIICFSTGCLSKLYGQKELIINNSNGVNEEFEIIKNNNQEIRDGSYVKYRNNFLGIQILETGSYSNNLKNGLWKYYFESGFGVAKNSVKEEGTFAFGRKQGIWRTYYPDSISDLINKKNYSNNQRIDSIELDIENKHSKIKSAGLFLNNKKSSIWSYFDYKGELIQKYNHSTNQIEFDNETDDLENSGLNHAATFLGGRYQMSYYFYSNFDFGYLNDKIRYDSSYINFSFIIDKDGNVDNVESFDFKASKPVIKSLTKLVLDSDSQWIPAIIDGTPTDYEYKMNFTLIRNNDREGKRYYQISFKKIE